MDTSRKIFVSYKYKDSNVFPLSEYTPSADTGYLHTPRHYVDKIIDVVGSNHIYKGELGDEAMDDLSDDTIDSKLKQKIFDSSVTIVLISPNMRDRLKLEKEQWIPREVVYSLRNKTRGDRISRTNAMLAVVLPDMSGSYEYAVAHKNCVTNWQTHTYFSILNKNMFNRKNKNQKKCDSCGGHHHYGEDHSYVHPVKWADFIGNHDFYINHALSLRENLEEFEITRVHN
ncbi:MAG: hypothetical protein ACD_8C00124G0015 [uncultured bacterium]|nr:MAG: hypothetical protein ACD_8C00124G0015 [uncultured bacterium]